MAFSIPLPTTTSDRARRGLMQPVAHQCDYMKLGPSGRAQLLGASLAISIAWQRRQWSVMARPGAVAAMASVSALMTSGTESRETHASFSEITIRPCAVVE